MAWLRERLLRWFVGDACTQLILHVQQAQAYAEYLPGGTKHGLVVSDHVLGEAVAADAVREELEAALRLVGAETGDA